MARSPAQNGSHPLAGHPWLVLTTVMVGTLLIGLDRTVVNLALPKIISDFGISVSTAAWIATAYIISNAVFVPVFGKLGDLLGNRAIYFWSFVGFIIVSILAGLSWNFSSLVSLRVLQGLVGAAVYPTAMSLIAKSFADPKARAQALGIWSSSFAVSMVIGPLLGGYLIDNFSWRWIFFIN
ncbi:MAG: MFS transporter, partial [Patescibacteria group bacterium]|nr:MFS transporter [Patescibacteria group bacterium]